MSGRARLATAAIMAALIWILAQPHPQSADGWIGFGLLGMLGIFAFTERQHTRGQK